MTQSSVTFSLCGTTGLTWTEVREAVTMADELGFDAYYTSDHLIPNTQIGATDDMLEAFTALSAVAMVTKRVRLGVMFAPVLFRHPVMLAKMATTLDHVSEGRAVIGLGAGGWEREYTAYGLDLGTIGRRIRMVREQIEVMIELFTKESASYKGKYYTLDNARFAPKPVQKPYPMLAVGGRSPSILRIAARYADLWDAHGSLALVSEKSRELDTICDEIRRDPNTLIRSHQVPLYVTDNRRDLDRFVDFMVDLRRNFPKPAGSTPEGERDEILRTSIAGDVEAVKAGVQRWADAGIRHLVLYYPRHTPDRRRMLERFMSKVAPAFV
jgi:alkanesulfonate monooxygenase SsuD/methylene tetrahydromethanopterin reductase-like flavin-dependent oxidoreductase (luciferase family)